MAPVAAVLLPVIAEAKPVADDNETLYRDP